MSNRIGIDFFESGSDCSIEHWDALQVPRVGEFVELAHKGYVTNYIVAKVIWCDMGESAEVHVY